MRVELPFPASQLFPNAARRLHWRVRAEYAKPARMLGRVETLNALCGRAFAGSDEIEIEITYHPPTRRKYDSDGILSALKPTLDGIADALEIDDYCFNPIRLTRGDVTRGGKVIVEIKPRAHGVADIDHIFQEFKK